ncbi:phospholipase D-like domain-containing protein [Shewanella maritima]|nr:phospholipase D family protein [Shewanella maritima]
MERSHQILVKIASALISLMLISSCSANEQYLPIYSKDHCKQIPATEQGNLNQYLAPFTDKMTSSTGVYVLEQGTEAMLTRAWLSQQAQKTIDIQYFIFSADNIGLIAVDYLVRAANRGIKVRILVDDILVNATAEQLLKLSAHKNLEVKIYNPNINIGKNIAQKLYNVVTDFHGVNQRMHNKTFTVDGQVSITGGRNVADEYFGYDHTYNFRDRDVLVLGGATDDIQTSFNDYWQSALSVPIEKLVETSTKFTDDYSDLHNYACNPDNFVPKVRQMINDLPKVFAEIQQSGQLHWLNDVEYIADIPGKNTEDDFLGGGGKTTDKLIELAKSAKTSLTIQTPYLVTTKTTRALLKSLVDSGVKVKVLTNSLASNDNLEAFSGYQRDREEILETGIELYEFKPDAQIRQKVMSEVMQKQLPEMPIFGLHAKTMVIDNHTAVIGTFNLDPRSTHLNTESLVIIPSTQIASEVKRGMLAEMLPENAWRITPDSNPDSEVGRLKRMKVKLRRVVPKSIL